MGAHGPAASLAVMVSVYVPLWTCAGTADWAAGATGLLLLHDASRNVSPDTAHADRRRAPNGHFRGTPIVHAHHRQPSSPMDRVAAPFQSDRPDTSCWPCERGESRHHSPRCQPRIFWLLSPRRDVLVKMSPPDSEMTRSAARAHGGVASCVSGRPASQRVAQLEPTHRSHRARPAQGCRRTDLGAGHPVDARGGRGGDGAAGAAMSVGSPIPPLPEDRPVAARPPSTQTQVAAGCTGGPNRLGSHDWWLGGRDWRRRAAGVGASSKPERMRRKRADDPAGTQPPLTQSPVQIPAERTRGTGRERLPVRPRWMSSRRTAAVGCPGPRAWSIDR